MRIRKVDAKAFGPFTNTTVEYEPGLTLVFGPNESGKSTLHAATYAALCGRKRGRGAATKADQAFKRKHMPWDGQAWTVGSEIDLADGRRVALTHDLLGKVDCRAVDAHRGNDVSGRIMHEGAPDGSKFLGLNRSSFAAVAVVNQAQLLAILDEAGGLQQELQRAATSSAGERPAAGAIAAINTFHAENVGSDRAPKKPLRSAQAAEQEAWERLGRAQQAHDEYLRLLEEAHDAEAAAGEARRAAEETEAALEQALTLEAEVKELALRRADHARAHADATDAQERYDEARLKAEQARKLHERFGGVEPEGLSDGEQLARQVGAALEHWQRAPQIPTLTGPTAAELQARIDALPQRPDGDLEVHPGVTSAVESLAGARRGGHRRVAVAAPEPLGEVEERAHLAGASALRELALGLDGAPDVDAASTADRHAAEHLAEARRAREAAEAACAQRRTAWQSADASTRAADQALSDSRMQAAAPTSGVNIPLLVLGAALALGGAALLGMQAVLGGALLLAGAAVAVVALRGRKPAQTDPTTGPVADAVRAYNSSREASHNAKAALDEAEQLLQRATTGLVAADTKATFAASALTTAEQAWGRLRRDCVAAGVPQDAGELRRLAARIEAWQRQNDDHQRHLRAVEGDRYDIEQAERLLDEALTSRGATAPGTLDERLAEYRRACSTRAEQASKADQGPALLANLQQRQANEANAQQAARARREAFDALARAAVAIRAVGPGEELQETDADRLTVALQHWNNQRTADLKRSQQDQRDWASLQNLLAGGTLDELLGMVGAQRAEVQKLGEAATQAQAAVREAEGRVTALAAAIGLDPDASAAPQGLPVAQAHVAQARADRLRAAADAGKLRLEAGNAQTRASVMSDSLRPVADAETDLAAAVDELQRVQRLGETLNLTLGFLTEAQERVHRDIAPVLAKSIESRLATVTLGRYTRVRIDPETLGVQVAPALGEFVDADRLSFGTTEQIYLLVRIALAEMLGNGKEPCPLLLDDVTVHADGARTQEILQTLLALTEERQIILFTQEQDVLQWAQANLTDATRHKIIQLETIPTGS